jgi:hypothetical protein
MPSATISLVTVEGVMSLPSAGASDDERAATERRGRKDCPPGGIPHRADRIREGCHACHRRWHEGHLLCRLPLPHGSRQYTSFAYPGTP